MIDQLGGHRMIVGLTAVTDHLDLTLDEPVGGRTDRAASVGEVIVTVAPDLVLVGVDHDDVAFFNLRRGGLKIFGRDLAPLALGDVEADAGAEEAP